MATASTTRGSSMRWRRLRRGISTPCWPVRPIISQLRKKPSIFSLMPPTGSISPCWFSAPVTAMPWRTGTPAMDDSNAPNSAKEAESPSTPLYSCSNTMAALSASGVMCTNSAAR